MLVLGRVYRSVTNKNKLACKDSLLPMYKSSQYMVSRRSQNAECWDFDFIKTIELKKIAVKGPP